MTALDYLLQPERVKEAWAYFNDVQTKDLKYAPLMGESDTPAVEMNKERMERFLPELRKRYYDPTKYRTYLEQLGINTPPSASDHPVGKGQPCCLVVVRARPSLK